MLARDPIKTANPYGALNGRTRSASASTSKPIAPTRTPTSTGDEKKKRKKKKKSKPVLDTVSLGSSSVEEPVTDTDSVEAEPLPLARRLEIAASHTDLHAALVGLVAWSRLYIGTDTIMAFFHCDALQLLLVNVLTTRSSIKNDAVFDQLTTLLTNCLYVERGGKDISPNVQVARAVVDVLRALIESAPCASASLDEALAAERLAAYLSKVVLQYRMSLNGVSSNSSIAKELFEIESQLAVAARKDSAVNGETIRESFQRRDIRSDALALHELRLQKLAQLQLEDSQGDGKTQRTDIGYPTFAFEGPEDEIHVDEQQVQEIKALLTTLNDDRATALAPIEDKLNYQAEELKSLRAQRDELEAKLRAVNEKILATEADQKELETKTVVIHEEFEQRRYRFDQQHSHVLVAYHHQQRRGEVRSQFEKLIESIASIVSVDGTVESAVDKKIAAVTQHLEGVVRYFDSELPCVKFMKNRVEETKSALEKLTDQANENDAQGLHAEAEELHDKATAMRVHLEEDVQCVSALKTRDLEIVSSVERILSEPQFDDVLGKVDEHLKKEAQRHIEHVRKLHSESHENGSGWKDINGDGEDEDIKQSDGA